MRRMIRIPNLHFITTLLGIIAVALITYTDIHFVIIFMTTGVLAYLPSFWIASRFGLSITLYFKEHRKDDYLRFKSDMKFRGVYLISIRVSRDKRIVNDLDVERKYVLMKYVEAIKNIKYGFLLFILLMILSSFLIESEVKY